MHFRKSRRLMWILFGISIGLSLLLYANSDAPWMREWFFLIVLAPLLAGVVIVLLYWRCPYCGAPLPREGNIQYCPHCGKELPPEEK